MKKSSPIVRIFYGQNLSFYTIEAMTFLLFEPAYYLAVATFQIYNRLAFVDK